MRPIITRCTLLFSFLFVFNLSLYAADSESEKETEDQIEIQADKVTAVANEEIVQATGRVEILYQDGALTADKVNINRTTGKFVAEGNVSLSKGLQKWTGPKISGNMKTKEVQVTSGNAKFGPWYIKSNGMSRVIKEGQAEANETHLEEITFSTCDYLMKNHADWKMVAKSMVIREDKSSAAYNVKFYIGNVPVFWLPVIYLPAPDPNHLSTSTLKLGYSGEWGPYIGYERTILATENWTTRVMLDYRLKRGPGVGLHTKYITKNSTTDLLVYGMQDKDYPETGGFNGREYNKRFDVTENRYRVKFRHRWNFTENLQLNAYIDRSSDIDMLEDWYREEYRNDEQVASHVNLEFLNEDFELTLSARPRINSFYSVVQEFPGLHFNVFRRQLGDSNVFYQSESSLQQLEMRWRDVDRPRPLSFPPLKDLADYKSMRFDTMHSFYVPMKYDNWLNIIPRAGVRLTYYSDSSSKEVSINDLNNMFDIANPDNVYGRERAGRYDNKGGSLWRLTGEVGLELSYKKYKTWYGYKDEKWEIDGLRHIVEPYMNLTSIINPSEKKENIFAFDEVDRIDKLNVARVGVKQRFQTRRNEKIYTFATLENYADFNVTTRDYLKKMGSFGTKVTVNPSEELSLWTNMMIDMDAPDINELIVGGKFGEAGGLETYLSYVYRRAHESTPVYSMNSYLSNFSGDNVFSRDYNKTHSVRLQFVFPINEKMRGRVSGTYDIVRRRLAEHSYEIQRDLHSWIAALRYTRYDGGYNVMLMFYLKSIPSFKVKM